MTIGPRYHPRTGILGDMHLDENDIARYVDGRVTGVEREEMEQHLATCSRCREAVRVTRHMLQQRSVESSVEVDPAVKRRAENLVSRRPSRRSVLERMSHRPVRSAAIAALFLAVVVGVWAWQARTTGTDQFRSAASGAAFSVRLPDDGSTLAERPVFVVSSHPKAIAYRVTLYAAEGRVMWTKDTTAVRIPLPSDVDLERGEDYLWRADVLLPNGTRHRSDPHTFTYAP